MGRKRTKAVDLSDREARDLFGVHVPLGVCQKTLWPYPSDAGKKNPGLAWPAVQAMRNMLSDLLDITKGRNVRQVVFARQLHDYLSKKGVAAIANESPM